jgi:signal transduction histidine kinase
LGLLTAVKSFINNLPENGDLQINLNSNIYKNRFEQTIESVIYRIICELITNTHKHANANNIYIEIIEDGKTLNIKYLDDGQGFDYFDDIVNGKGMGLINIKSRIKSVHGTYQIYSRVGEGFNANFVLNL